MTHERETILLADDEDLVRDVAARALSEAGFSVLTAIDGQDAVEIYREHKDHIDLVLLDMTMPRLNGHEALAALVRENPNVRVLATSGYVLHAMEPLNHDNLAGFLDKPFRPSTLVEKIRTVLKSD